MKFDDLTPKANCLRAPPGSKRDESIDSNYRIWAPASGRATESFTPALQRPALFDVCFSTKSRISETKFNVTSQFSMEQLLSRTTPDADVHFGRHGRVCREQPSLALLQSNCIDVVSNLFSLVRKLQHH
jgi:hypothetical protein